MLNGDSGHHILTAIYPHIITFTHPQSLTAIHYPHKVLTDTVVTLQRPGPRGVTLHSVMLQSYYSGKTAAYVMEGHTDVSKATSSPP